jgi:hypothetical protein
MAIALVACGGGGSGRPDADIAPYFQSCGGDAGACPAPYECTPVQPAHQPDAALEDRCLIPCDADDDCPATCCCRGTTCGADVGKDGYCVCV